MTFRGFMAKSEGIETGTETAPPKQAMAAPRTVSPSTSVDATTKLEGTLHCKETLRIDGVIKGRVECEKVVLVGEGANVQASIEAHEIQVNGTVKGDIVARRKISLGHTAVVTGDLTTPGIVIEEGAKVKGRIVIGSDAEPVRDPKPESEVQEDKRTPKKPAAKVNDAPARAPASA